MAVSNLRAFVAPQYPDLLIADIVGDQNTELSRRYGPAEL